MEVCLGRNRERLVVAARRAGYGSVSDKWCEDFLSAARTDGRERSVKESFRQRYANLNRGGKKKFFCFRRILIVYEDRRPVDFQAIVDVQDQILRSPDRSPSGEEKRNKTLFAVAVSIQLHTKARKADRIPDAPLA